MTYMVGWVRQCDPLYNGIPHSAAAIHQRHVVGAEVVTVWCWVERYVDACVEGRRLDHCASYPTAQRNKAVIGRRLRPCLLLGGLI